MTKCYLLLYTEKDMVNHPILEKGSVSDKFYQNIIECENQSK